MPALLEMPASIDADRFAGDEVGLAEQHDGLGDFRLAAPVADGRGPGDFLHFLGAHVRWRHDRTRRDGIHEDVVARPPAVSTSATVCSASSFEPRYDSTRFMPRSANSRATTRPIRFPPVMTATLPQRSMWYRP